MVYPSLLLILAMIEAHGLSGSKGSPGSVMREKSDLQLVFRVGKSPISASGTSLDC
jgi:hypothetical protein